METEPIGPPLADALSAIGSSVRLALLRQLRSPKAMRDIALQADGPDGSPRPLARQTLKEHLDKLVETGVVRAREAERDYGPTVEYVVDHRALFAIAEEVRALARLRPAEELDQPTVQHVPGAARADLAAPCLVLVRGLDEGSTFDLRPPLSGRREWLIGRSRGVAVSLDFDPFVSTENSAIVWDRGQHWVVDLPDSRNGTTLNFAPVPKGEPQPLRHGDLIGVGRTILLYRDGRPRA